MSDPSTPLFKAQVKDLSLKGLGVVENPQGKILFVPGVWPGDLGLFTEEKAKKNYGFGRLLQLLERSPHRHESVPCPHQGFSSGQCGACPWMIADYPSQLEYKQKLLLTSLNKGQLITPTTKIEMVAGSPQSLGYRNRVQLKTEGHSIGFVSSGSKALSPIQDCLVLNEKMRNLLKALLRQLPNIAWTPPSHFIWSFLEFDDSFTIEDIVANKKMSFRQANEEQNILMKDWCEAWARSLDPRQSLIELFCGAGNFTEVLSRSGFREIFAIESDGSALKQLQDRSLAGVKTKKINLFSPRNWTSLIEWSRHSSPLYLFLDPPRGGFPQIDLFCSQISSLEKIMYVSCDLSGFVSDARKLKSQGWKLDKVQPVDQFPQTPHLELLAQFIK